MASEAVRNEQGTQIVWNVVSTVAAADGVDPLDLPPLGHVVDTDALESFMEGADADVTIRFPYQDRWVVVSGDGTVTLEDSRG